MSDIRKWFMKHNDKDNGNAQKPAKPATSERPKLVIPTSQPGKMGQGSEESSGRRKTSKYFSTDKPNPQEENKKEDSLAKRKAAKGGDELSSDVKPSPGAKRKAAKADNDENDDFVAPNLIKGPLDVTPNKKPKTNSSQGPAQRTIKDDESDEDHLDDKKTKSHPQSASARGRGGRGASARTASRKSMDIDESGIDNDDDEDKKSPVKSTGRGRGGRGAAAAPAAGRGRGGGGRGGFMNFGERKDPPHKGEKEVPEGAPNCLAGLTFVISGTLDSLEREEAEDLIKRHGGRVTGSVSKKTNYLLCDEDIGGRKSSKAKELGTIILSEDGLFDMIRASAQAKKPAKEESRKPMEKDVASVSKKSPQKVVRKDDQIGKGAAPKRLTPGASSAKRKDQTLEQITLPWTEKYRPKVPNDVIGNQSLVKQLHDWLVNWNKQFLNTGSNGKGKKLNDSGAKKAVLLSGTPGIGKTTSAKVVSQMLGFQAIEVNASDSRGKADAKIQKGIGGSTANSIKELVRNESLSANMDRLKHPKTVLIMDEVDGMSAGDRGGVADLIASIKTSKIPIICICNDRFSQKLKSLVNYCLPLNFRKPTKQQMAKRLMQVANAEKIQANEIALEELAERVNGDMRMALNQLQYMSLSMSVIKYDDVRQRLLGSSKDEDISPFTAVDKLFGFNAGKLRMDERINLSMSDPDLVPLLIQENYINYRPSSVSRDDNGMKRMSLIARAAESIADGDIVNVQIRRYQRWQLSQTSTLASCLIPSALLHGQREILEQGERNFNRFGGWLGKNSTMGKNLRLLEDMHVHLLASRESNLGRATLRLDYFTLLLKKLTDPLRVLPKDEAVEKVVEFMDSYSINQEDFETVVEVSKFKGHPNPMDGIQPAVKAALTKAYNRGSSSRVVRTADFITFPGMKKAPKKRIAAMLEPLDDGLAEGDDDALLENEDNSSDAEELDGSDDVEKKLQSLNSKGIQVHMDLKNTGKGSAKKTQSGRGKKGGSEAAAATGKKAGGGSSSSATKRKR